MPERGTPKFSGNLVDENSNPLPTNSINTLTLTLHDEKLTIINGRDGVDIKNVNGGSIDANGKFSLTLSPADMVILDTASHTEERIALVEWTWGAGKEGRVEIHFQVENLSLVP